MSVAKAITTPSIGRTVIDRDLNRQQIDDGIRLSHADSYRRYGSPNIHAELIEKGIKCCVNTVAARMRALGIRSVVHQKFRVTTTDSDHELPVHENGLDRDFVATLPNQKWVADITDIHTDEGFLYLAGVVDLFSRKIVGWSMKDSLHSDLCIEAASTPVANTKKTRRVRLTLQHESGRKLLGQRGDEKRLGQSQN